ncbi:MAG: class III signal peptide-containing protein [Candidatus Micrarchaeota archaeon]
MKRGQGAFEYMLLLAGILAIALVAFFMLRNTNSSGKNQVDFATCASKLSVASVCYDDAGVWKSDVVTPYSAPDYNIPKNCNADIGGGLAGTQYDVVGTDNEFYCGKRPPQ